MPVVSAIITTFNRAAFLKEAAESVMKQSLEGKEPKPIYYPDRPGEQMRYCLDNSKPEKELNPAQGYSSDTGLEET